MTAYVTQPAQNNRKFYMSNNIRMIKPKLSALFACNGYKDTLLKISVQVQCKITSSRHPARHSGCLQLQISHLVRCVPLQQPFWFNSETETISSFTHCRNSQSSKEFLKTCSRQKFALRSPWFALKLKLNRKVAQQTDIFSQEGVSVLFWKRLNNLPSTTTAYLNNLPSTTCLPQSLIVS